MITLDPNSIGGLVSEEEVRRTEKERAEFEANNPSQFVPRNKARGKNKAGHRYLRKQKNLWDHKKVLFPSLPSSFSPSFEKLKKLDNAFIRSLEWDPWPDWEEKISRKEEEWTFGIFCPWPFHEEKKVLIWLAHNKVKAKESKRKTTLKQKKFKWNRNKQDRNLKWKNNTTKNETLVIRRGSEEYSKKEKKRKEKKRKEKKRKEKKRKEKKRKKL